MPANWWLQNEIDQKKKAGDLPGVIRALEDFLEAENVRLNNTIAEQTAKIDELEYLRECYESAMEELRKKEEECKATWTEISRLKDRVDTLVASKLGLED